jgi:transcriptional regulator with XRE-family HTH domain
MNDTHFDTLRCELAQRIREARLEAGLSQDALALQAKVDRSYVFQLERGIANPSLLIPHRIATVLGT